VIPGKLPAVLARDRRIVVLALVLLTLLSWVYIIYLARQMDMGGMDMTGFRMGVTATGMIMLPNAQPWTLYEFVFTFVMWVIMMIGMMTPSAAPIILLYAKVGLQATSQGKPFASTAWFAGGYMLAWTLFGLAAAILQWMLDRAALLTPAMASASNALGAAVLIAAGIYQWTRLKDACLSQCESPLQFIMRHGGLRREGPAALRMGTKHGFYCVGCCWALMALLFVGGVMNVLWIALIAGLVLIEKVFPLGRVVARVAGVFLIAGGVWLLVAA
jgi:predicted metal-binding membrane protein